MAPSLITSFLAGVTKGATSIKEPHLSACILLARNHLGKVIGILSNIEDLVTQAWNTFAHTTSRLITCQHADKQFASPESNPFYRLSNLLRLELVSSTLFIRGIKSQRREDMANGLLAVHHAVEEAANLSNLAAPLQRTLIDLVSMHRAHLDMMIQHMKTAGPGPDKPIVPPTICEFSLFFPNFDARALTLLLLTESSALRLRLNNLHDSCRNPRAFVVFFSHTFNLSPASLP